MDDVKWMRHALSLARRGLGRVAPNPAVGCVLVRGGAVVGTGRTGDGGRPHAETEALRQAGDKARGATAYVTLEPCAHHGQTGPCAEALISSGIARCVVAMRDPDSRVSGRGIAMLTAAGVEVREGICEADAREANAGFFLRIEQGRPFVSLKVATSADGFVADSAGRSQWITGSIARAMGHRLRATHDAILTGSGTVLADDPLLTCRLPGTNRQPLRLVLDRRLRLPVSNRLADSLSSGKVRVLAADDAPVDAQRAIEATGIEIVRLDDSSPRGVLAYLGGAGITRLLIEAGPKLSTAFLPEADRLHWFRAPLFLGNGKPVFGALGELENAPRWHLAESRSLGVDRYEVYRRR